MIKSRLTYFVIFFLTILKLHKLLRESKPEYIIVHLVTFVPLTLLLLFNYKTRFILRISGYPKLTFFRSLLWKLVSKKIYIITAPTSATAEMLKKKNIFNSNKIKYLPDPVLKIDEIQKKKIKSVKIKSCHLKNSLISIGRLTPQKNFTFLINIFSKISKNHE